MILYAGFGWVGMEVVDFLAQSVVFNMFFSVLSLWSLRAKFALDDTKINMLHGSDSEDQAKRELEFFFPMQQTVAVIKPDAVGTKGTKWKGFLVNELECISTSSCILKVSHNNIHISITNYQKRQIWKIKIKEAYEYSTCSNSGDSCIFLFYILLQMKLLTESMNLDSKLQQGKRHI